MRIFFGKTGGIAQSLPHFFFLAIAYLFALPPDFWSDALMPGYDSLDYHFPNFVYYVRSIAYHHGIPAWDPSFGGIQLGIDSLSHFPLIPYRLAGYAVYLLRTSSDIAAYKSTLIAGTSLMSLGWWLFLRRLAGIRLAATFGTLMILMGGSGITAFHQEQALATGFWMPWAMLAASYAGERPRCLILLGAVAGTMMTVHYPQIQVLVILFALIAFASSGSLGLRQLRKIIDGKLALIALAAFLAAASPTLFVWSELDGISSPVREVESLGPSDMSEYLRLNNMQKSSAKPAYLKIYFASNGPDGEMYDSSVFYATIAGLCAAIYGLVYSFKKTLPFLIVFGLSLWAALGVNGFLPQILFALKFPFIGYFRQWIHFSPAVNFSLSAMGAIGFASAFAVLESHERGGRTIALLTAFAVIFTAAAEGKRYFRFYAERIMVKNLLSPASMSEESFYRTLGSGFFRSEYLFRHLKRPSWPAPLFSYKEHFAFLKACPGQITLPVISSYAYDMSGIPAVRRREILEEFCRKGLIKSAALADMGGSGSVKKIGMDFRDGSPVFSPPPPDALSIIAMPDDYLVTPEGVTLRVSSSSGGLAVLPFSPKNGFSVFVNGSESMQINAFSGAMTAVYVGRGESVIRLKVRRNLFFSLLCLQYLALLLSLLLCLFKSYSERKT